MLRALKFSKRVRRRQALPAGLQDAWQGVRCTSTSSAAPVPAGDAAAAVIAGGEVPASPDRVAKVLAHSFHKAPKDTAAALMRELSELDRIHLVLALQRSTSKEQLKQAETHYVDDLVKQVSVPINQQHAKLTRQQIHNAVIYQRMLQKFAAVSEDPPSWRQLAAVGAASGLPFVVFGVLDNGIMLVAGEQIDHLFGARLGLSMMASAGLGNLVADVVGVSATHTVQENIKRIPFARPPRLSMLQQQQPPVKRAQFIGAAAGVAFGCLVGMTPLFFMDPGWFVPAAELAANAAAALGATGGGAAEAAADSAAAAAAALAEGASSR